MHSLALGRLCISLSSISANRCGNSSIASISEKAGSALHVLSCSARVLGSRIARLPRKKLEHDDTHRMDITPWCPQALCPNLGWCVARGASRMPIDNESLRQSKVDDFGVWCGPHPLIGNHHIGLLQITVDGALAVEVHHPIKHLIRDVREVSAGDGTPALIALATSTPRSPPVYAAETT